MTIQNHVALCFLIRDDEVLLAMNHDRPGKTTWNGIGAVTETTENATQKIAKEIYRLTKLNVYEYDLKQAGVIHYFIIDDNQNRNESLTITLYTCHKWQGQIANATGTRPTWFSFDEIPYEDLHQDAKSWLPKLLEGDKIIAEVYSTQDPVTQSEAIQDVLIRTIM